MGKRKKRERQRQEQAAAAQRAAAQRAAAERAEHQRRLQQQQQSYQASLRESQNKIAELATANVEAPTQQRVGMGVDEAENQYRRRSRSRFGLAATRRAGNTGGFRSLLG